MPDGGFRYSVMCKPLAGRHCFTTMLGYCLKDDGMDWFRCRMFNVTRYTQSLLIAVINCRDEMEQGRSAHTASRTSYDQNKVLLTQRNVIAEMFKYANRSLHPCHVPLRYALLYAIQSGLYIPSPEWLKRFGKLEHSDAQSMWNLIYTPSRDTIKEIDSIFFDPQSMPQAGARRYFCHETECHAKCCIRCTNLFRYYSYLSFVAEPIRTYHDIVASLCNHKAHSQSWRASHE